MLKQADSVKTANHEQFLGILAQLEQESAQLSDSERLYLRYLNAWQTAYSGAYEKAVSEFKQIIDGSSDPLFRFRAEATAVNVLTFAKRYEEAFSFESRVIEELGSIRDPEAREQGLVVSAILYNQVGQYELASAYADRVVNENPAGKGACKGGVLKQQSLYKSGKLDIDGAEFQSTIQTCVERGELVYANVARTYAAKLLIGQSRFQEAIALLDRNYADVQRARYPILISDFDALLAQAHWGMHAVEKAKAFAARAVASRLKNEYTEPLAEAYRILYLAARDEGDLHSALGFHEQYMDVDKGYLDDVSAGRLAFQMADHQAIANKLQIETLNRQNQVLQLQQALGDKAVENSRLYIALLISVLAFIGFWAYKTKRSQLHFMKLARRDGLTGIFNRHHFISSAEHALEYCRKSARPACVVIIDLDHFKLVNDEHGHAAGDLVLKRTVAACQAQLRSIDIFGRLGGEEFGILLPECDPQAARTEADRIRVAIGALAHSERGIDFPVSASLGITSTEWSGYELRDLLAHADQALYQAKREGRDRVEAFDPRRAETAPA